MNQFDAEDLIVVRVNNQIIERVSIMLKSPFLNSIRMDMRQKGMHLKLKSLPTLRPIRIINPSKLSQCNLSKLLLYLLEKTTSENLIPTKGLLLQV